jgi:AraC family ethanolamine operon transcriptional activator
MQLTVDPRPLDATIRQVPAREPVRDHADVLRRAETYMWDHVEEPLDLASISRAAGCGVRKLLYCFNRAYHMGPLAYFKLNRLQAVRAALESDMHHRTILDIAADYGFWHLGHFGADYKALFGLTPSQTRRLAAARVTL